jgi:predicted AAA+ superfamily ATPase
MSNITRYLQPHITKDLEKKMVFVSGPRQVGKTTMALTLPEAEKGYMNWDIDEDRENILQRKFPIASLWVFDEIHKYRSWRRLLKGFFDDKEMEQRMLVTGSARLDYYRYGGDSLQGRYFFWRLHTLSCAELQISNQSDFVDLCTLGGFPEQFTGDSQKDSRRWSREYRNRLIQDDLLNIENIRDIGNLELLMLRLPECVGSPLSVNALREDLQVNHRTVDNWLRILERMYAIFRLAPFGADHIRAVKKEQKHYHYDWTLVKNPGERFENCVACHLLKWVHFLQDSEGRDIELRYFRDVDGREVDFVIVENSVPLLCVECKLSQTDVHPALKYFKERFPDCKAIQLLAESEKEFKTQKGIFIQPAYKFLAELV